MSTIIIMLAVLIFFAVVNGMNGINFLASENLSVIVNQASFLVIVGIGQAIVILTLSLIHIYPTWTPRSF